MFQSGDVVLVPFPFTDFSAAKKRPVLVVRPMDSLGDLVCMAITSSPGHEDAIALDAADFEEGILPKASWVRYAKLYTIHEEVVIGRFGRLNTNLLDRVRNRFCRHFGCL